jgi:hypothetical protein
MKRDRKLMYYLLLQTRDRQPPPELANYSQDLQTYNAALLIEDGYIRGEALPGPGGRYIEAALEDLTSRGHDLLERMDAEFKSPVLQPENVASPSVSVFISHSSRDKNLAEAMVDLLRFGIGLTEQEIRCTSVDGYRFKIGTETDAQLKKEVKGSKAFIGLITPSSIQSAYVLFELGARWGADLHLAPVLARGADSSFLRGPLANLNALNAVEEGQMHQLVNDVASQIGRNAASAAVYQKALQKLIAAARMETTAPKQGGDATLEFASSVPKIVRDELIKLLAKHDSLTVGEYANFAGIGKTRAEHFASELVKDDFLGYGINKFEQLYYYLSDKGRAYAVSNDLDK